MREISCMARPIELRDSANYPITAAHVGALLDEVNVIFRQVGLHFSVGAPLRVVENDQWAQYGLLRRDCGNAIRNIMSGTGGVEVYFIPGADAETENARNEPLGTHNPYGIVVKTIASGSALAHEIGHACGWYDIYNDEEGFDVSELLLGMRSEWLPNDWNNGTGGRFYDPLLTQYALIQRLLMYGRDNAVHSDIPAGNVYGLRMTKLRSSTGRVIRKAGGLQPVWVGGTPSVPHSL